MALSDSWKYSKNRFKTAVSDTTSKLVTGISSKLQKFLYVPAIIDNNASNLLPSQLSRILDDAAEGDCQEQANLIQWAMECDPKFAAHLLTRQDAVSAANWYFVPPGAEEGARVSYEDNPELAEFHAVMESSKFTSLLRHWNAATIFGYSAAAFEVVPGGAGFRWHPIDVTSIRFDAAGGPVLVDEEDNEFPVEKLPPGSVVVHVAQTRTGHPARRGLARMLLWFWLFKHMTLDRWAKFVSRFGVPFLVARMSRSHFENEKARASIIRNIRKMASDGVVAATENWGLEMQTAPGQNSNVHSDHVNMINNEYAMLVLGQVGSSEGERGRLGNNRAQEEVRQDKRESDCNALAETAQDGIVTPTWIAMHGGDGTDAPRLILRSLRSRQLRELAASAKDFSAGGYTMDRTFIEKETGIPMQEIQVQDDAAVDDSQDDGEATGGNDDSNENDNNSSKD